MTTIADRRAILAIDPTSRGFAFVFFENGDLLDWGTRRYDGSEIALLERLLARLRVDVLVIENPDAARCERKPKVKALLRRLASVARSAGIEVHTVSRFDVRQEYAARGQTRKHAVAASIAALFPELEPLVPRKRKVYRSEDARADIFDALSLLLHVWPASSEDTSRKGAD